MSSRRARGDGGVYYVHHCGPARGDSYPCGQERCPSGRWRGSVEVDDPTGRRRRRYFSGKTEAAVRRRVRAALAEAQRGQLTATRAPTLEEWLGHWLLHVAPDRCQTSTLNRYRTVTKHWIVPLIGGRRLDKLSVDDIRRVYTAMRDAGREASARQAHAVLRRSLRVAQQEGRVTQNVAALLDGPAYDRPEVEPLSSADAAAVLRAAALTPMPARWASALCLGMRQGEVLGLSWDDVDLDAGVLRVVWQMQARRFEHQCGMPKAVQETDRAGRQVVRDRYPCGAKQPMRCTAVPESDRRDRLYIKKLKTRNSRRPIPLPEPLVVMLREHRQRQLEMYLASGLRPGWTTTPEKARRPIVHDLVFANAAGGPIEPGVDSRAWKTLLVSAGVPEARLHDARHTAATVMLELGVETKMVSAILGHSSTYFTQDTYQHWVPSLASAATDAVGAALLGGTAPPVRRTSRGRQGSR